VDIVRQQKLSLLNLKGFTRDPLMTFSMLSKIMARTLSTV
jgi:hypothetical protein